MSIQVRQYSFPYSWFYAWAKPNHHTQMIDKKMIELLERFFFVNEDFDPNVHFELSKLGQLKENSLRAQGMRLSEEKQRLEMELKFWGTPLKENGPSRADELKAELFEVGKDFKVKQLHAYIHEFRNRGFVSY